MSKCVRFCLSLLATLLLCERLLPKAAAAPSLQPEVPALVSKQRILFPVGMMAYTLSTDLAAGEPQGYVLGIQAGQELFITANGNVSVAVLGPDERLLLQPTTFPGPLVVGIPATADYTVLLTGQGKVNVSFYIPALAFAAQPPVPLPTRSLRVSFPFGAASYSVATHLMQGKPQGYTLTILAGQHVLVTTQGNATAAVLDAENNPLAPIAFVPGQLEVLIPQTGDYQIVLLGEGKTTTTFQIPPLLE